MSEPEVFSLVEDGQARATIAVGPEASPTERHAAGELADYVQAMTGARLSIRTATMIPTRLEERVIAIGRSETNPVVGQLVDAGRIRLSIDEPGLDGYVIQTGGERLQALVLGGSRDRGTLYAVYDLLARFGHVGFFWDAERIPHPDRFVVPEVCIAERPSFRDRLATNTAWGYSMWKARSMEDWKGVIDWAAKNRFNQVTLYADATMPRLFWNQVKARMGILPEPVPTAKEEAEVDLFHGILRYCQRLDLDAVPLVIPDTTATPEFRAAFPEARFFEGQWAEGTPPRIHLDPADPAYGRYVQTAIEVWREMFPESGHLYFGGETYGELQVHLSAEEIDEVLVSLARTTMTALQKADPEGVWMSSGWNFLFDTTLWTPKRTEAFFANLRGRSYIVQDLTCDERPFYTEGGRYWYGKPWLFGILHSYGGDDHLHGDLAGTLKLAQAVVTDPKAENCIGFAVTTEVFGYCMLYYDFLGRIAWDPRSVGLDGYLEDFALRRYGAEAGPGLVAHLKGLARTVYGPAGGSKALHQAREMEGGPTAMIWPRFGGYWGILSRSEAIETAEVLDGFVRALLDQADRLGKEKVYLDDLVDFARQYLTEVANAHRVLLDRAFVRGDREDLEAEAKVLDDLLHHLERVVSTRWEYRVTDVYNHQMASAIWPYDGGPTVPDWQLTFAVSVPSLLDYSGKDMHELLRFYYRPRVEAYVGYLRERMEVGETSVVQSDLDALYRPIEIRWVEEGFDPAQVQPFAGTCVFR